jgi:hypothetical protein
MTQFNSTLTAAPRKTELPVVTRLKNLLTLWLRGAARRSRLQAEYAEMIEAYHDKI